VSPPPTITTCGIRYFPRSNRVMNCNEILAFPQSTTRHRAGLRSRLTADTLSLSNPARTHATVLPGLPGRVLRGVPVPPLRRSPIDAAGSDRASAPHARQRVRTLSPVLDEPHHHRDTAGPGPVPRTAETGQRVDT